MKKYTDEDVGLLVFEIERHIHPDKELGRSYPSLEAALAPFRPDLEQLLIDAMSDAVAALYTKDFYQLEAAYQETYRNEARAALDVIKKRGYYREVPLDATETPGAEARQ